MARQKTRPPISRLSRRLIVGIGLGFLAVLVTLVAVGLALDHHYRTIAQDLDVIVKIEEPTCVAGYEMEINALGVGLAVQKYLLTGDPAHVERVNNDEADFNRFSAEYQRLADVPSEQELGSEIERLSEQYRHVARVLMGLRDRREALLTQLADSLERIDREFENVVFRAPENEAGYREALGLEADIGELGAWLGNYIVTSREPYRQGILADLGHVREHAARFRKLSLDSGEEHQADCVEAGLERVTNLVPEILLVHDSLRENEADFTRLRGELDALLDEGIQAKSRQDLLASHDDARVNLLRLRRIGNLLIAVSALVALTAAVVISRHSLELRDASADELRSSVERLRASETLRGALLRRLVFVQEEERARIARELHDQMGQGLAALSLGLASVGRTSSSFSSDDSERLGQIRALQDLTNRIADEVHLVAWQLRPAILDDLGLHGAITNLVESWTKHSGVLIDLYSDEEVGRLPRERETTLYRVVQEALTNAAKHARAHSISVTLNRLGDQVRLVVEDDGCGFDMESSAGTGSMNGHLGLLGMRERVEQVGGSLEIDSAPGKGTTIVACIPVRAEVLEGVGA